ncbi:MAG: hypothetical protein ABH812_02125 [bacterium]
MSQKNYTPLDINKLGKQTKTAVKKPYKSNLSTILIIIAIITAIIIAFVLILLIQQKSQVAPENTITQPQPTVIESPTPIPTVEPEPTIAATSEAEPTPEAQEEAIPPSQIITP